MFLKNRKISTKIKRSKVTDYAALSQNQYKTQTHLTSLIFNECAVLSARVDTKEQKS